MKNVYRIVLIQFFVALIFVTIACSCHRRESIESNHSIVESISFPGESTCISLSSDSMSMYVGMMEDFFMEYSLLHGTQSKYILPSELRGIKTYQIFELSKNSTHIDFLISKRNKGVVYLRYSSNVDSNSVHPLDICVWLSSDNSQHISPKKYQNYSAYKIMQCDDVLLLGTSNGLMYVSKEMLDSVRSIAVNGSTVEIPYYRPLLNLRQHKMQFAIENIIVSSDEKKIIAVTDSGIYQMTHNIHSSIYDKMIIGGRFWSSCLKNDILHVECINPDDGYKEYVIVYPFSDRPHVSEHKCDEGHRLLLPSIGVLSDSRFEFNDNKFSVGFKYQGLESIHQVDNTIYYLSQSGVDKLDLTLLSTLNSLNYCSIKSVVAGEDAIYFITETTLYKLISNGQFKYLGPVYGLPDIKDATWHSGKVYVCDDISVYSIDVSDYLLASDRNVTQVDMISIPSPDRIECIVESPTGEGLYIGTRSGLYEYKDNQSFSQIEINNAAFHDSPYITDIVVSDGKLYAGTLNQGLIAVGSSASVIDDYKNIGEIKSLDVFDNKLLIRTTSSLLIADALNYNTLASVDIKGVLDAALTAPDTLCVLTKDSISYYALNKGGFPIKFDSYKNNYQYNRIKMLNYNDYLISDTSIVNGQMVTGNDAHWYDVVYFVFISILIVLLCVGVLILFLRQRKVHAVKEQDLLDNIDQIELYKKSSSKLLSFIPTIISNLEIYDEMDTDLCDLVSLFVDFRNKMVGLEDSSVSSSLITDFQSIYNDLYLGVAKWFKRPSEDADIKTFNLWLSRCRYGFQVINVYNKKGIKLLVENPDDISSKDFEIEKSMTWEFFVRFTLCNQSVDDIIAHLISLNIEDSEDTKACSQLRKKLKERIDHKNVGPIPNLLIRNLSSNIWRETEPAIASTPYDVVWIALELGRNNNGIQERLDYALSQKGSM